MKIKAIEKICKAAKTVHVWRLKDGRAFAGDGMAFYQLPDSLAMMNARQLLDVFDVPDEKRDDWMTEDRAGTEATDALFGLSEADDTDAQTLPVTIGFNDDVWRPVADALQTVVIPDRQIAPLGDEDCLRFFLRRVQNGTPLVVIRSGVLLRAIVMPHHPAEDLGRRLAQIGTDMMGGGNSDD